jgi:hypothetical protein
VAAPPFCLNHLQTAGICTSHRPCDEIRNSSPASHHLFLSHSTPVCTASQTAHFTSRNTQPQWVVVSSLTALTCGREAEHGCKCKTHFSPHPVSLSFTHRQLRNSSKLGCHACKQPPPTTSHSCCALCPGRPHPAAMSPPNRAARLSIAPIHHVASALPVSRFQWLAVRCCHAAATPPCHPSCVQRRHATSHHTKPSTRSYAMPITLTAFPAAHPDRQCSIPPSKLGAQLGDENHSPCTLFERSLHTKWSKCCAHERATRHKPAH